MYASVKEVTVNKRRNCKSNAIKDKDGTLLTEPEEIQRRWQEYMETLYDTDGTPKLEDMGVEEENEVSLEAQGPSLLESKIRMAIKEMKNKKSTGIDNISPEMIKSLGEKATEELVLLCKHMYNKGEWPDDFSKSIVVPIEKKAIATECGDFRTISLIPHASKIVLKILTTRITTKAKESKCYRIAETSEQYIVTTYGYAKIA